MTPRPQTPAEPLDELIGLARAAKAFDVSERTMRRHIASGRLPAYRVGGTRTIRVRRADVAALLEPVPTIGTMRHASIR